MKTRLKYTLTAFMVAVAVIATAQVKKIGIIGLDTSHALQFIKIINGGNIDEPYRDFKVVAAYPYGSQTIESSYKRIPQYIETVKKEGVEIVGSIDELLGKTDYILLETNDGNLHLDQIAQVYKSGKAKRVFLDKPIAANLVDAIVIAELAKKYNQPFFSSSSMRFTPETQAIASGKYGPVLGADSYSPAHKEPSHSEFMWYGIHGAEVLFTVMGAGCKEVVCISGDSTDVVTGRWGDGRVGTFRGSTNFGGIYGGHAYTKKGAFPLGTKNPYPVITNEIVKFLATGVSPVPVETTIEIFTFLEAAAQSKQKGGAAVSLKQTYDKAYKEAVSKLKKY